MKFIYAGENERPVNSVNFRKKIMGGLGVFNPIMKCKPLLLKSMFKEYKDRYGDVDLHNLDQRVYGYWSEFKKLSSNSVDVSSCRTIYEYLLEEITHRNGELIPSRNELRSVGINWANVYNNFQVVKGITSSERCFYWKMLQDMLEIGSRMHRRDADKRCRNLLDSGDECPDLQTMVHLFQDCPVVTAARILTSNVMAAFLGSAICHEKILYLDFKHSNIHKLKCGIWFGVKVTFKIYNDKCFKGILN